MARYEVVTGLSYPTDPVVDDALRELGRQAQAAREQFASSRDLRDYDAWETADRARAEAVAQALSDGSLKRAEPGAIVDDLPEQSVPWLLEHGYIRAAADQESPISDATWRDLGRPDDADFEGGQ